MLPSYIFLAFSYFSTDTSWAGLVSECPAAEDSTHMSSSPENLIDFYLSQGHLLRSSADPLLHMCGATNFLLILLLSWLLVASLVVLVWEEAVNCWILSTLSTSLMILKLSVVFSMSLLFSKLKHIGLWSSSSQRSWSMTRLQFLPFSESFPVLLYIFFKGEEIKLHIVFIMWINNGFIQWIFPLITFIRTFS